MKAVPVNRIIVFAAAVVAGCLLDLFTKHAVFAGLGHPVAKPRHVWANLYLETSLNEGALFGIGQGKTPLFAALSLAAVAAILYWLFVAGAARDWKITAALALITAGILGNLYDRLGLPGLTWPYASPWHQVGDRVYAVRDWILVYIGSFPWPTFNLADSMLVCGAFLLVWSTGRRAPDAG
jgi:signal peptidase II